MEGLFMLPRTIDKLRANLPGGKIGTYTIRGSSPLLPGLSLVLLDGIGVTEQCLLDVVERASVEEEIADVFLYLVRLADKLRVNLFEVAERKIKINIAKYPANRVRGSAKKYSDYS